MAVLGARAHRERRDNPATDVCPAKPATHPVVLIHVETNVRGARHSVGVEVPIKEVIEAVLLVAFVEEPDDEEDYGETGYAAYGATYDSTCI